MNPTLLDSITEVSTLTGEDLSLLLTCVVSRDLKKGELLLKEGEICRAFYLVDRVICALIIAKTGQPSI